MDGRIDNYFLDLLEDYNQGGDNRTWLLKRYHSTGSVLQKLYRQTVEFYRFAVVFCRLVSFTFGKCGLSLSPVPAALVLLFLCLITFTLQLNLIVFVTCTVLY